MSNIPKQNWFRMSLSKAPDVVSLCCAEDYSQAAETFGVLGQGENIFQLNWSELSELTGCIVPCTATSTELACGGLMFRKGCRLVSIWQSVV